MVFLRQRELQLIPGASTGMHGSSALKEKMENQVSEERAKSKGSETWLGGGLETLGLTAALHGLILC